MYSFLDDAFNSSTTHSFATIGRHANSSPPFRGSGGPYPLHSDGTGLSPPLHGGVGWGKKHPMDEFRHPELVSGS
ncbi:MAG: hypothetical protein IJJ66_09280, partial [Treponema sp.]|nr:hypothetical protein [Treponema sp.]